MPKKLDHRCLGCLERESFELSKLSIASSVEADEKSLGDFEVPYIELKRKSKLKKYNDKIMSLKV